MDAMSQARMFGADHYFMMVRPEDYLKYYENYLWDLEEPVGNESAAAFYFVSKIAREKVKVALAGQGADEPWAGYDRYLGAKLSTFYSQIPSMVTGPLASFVNKIPGRFERLKRGVSSLSEPDMLTRFTKMYSFFSAEMKQQLFKGPLTAQIANDAYQIEGGSSSSSNRRATLGPGYSNALYRYPGQFAGRSADGRGQNVDGKLS